ncbi:MAG: hypothetical protein ACI9C9_001255, partial [Marivirga sp.]
LQSVSIYQSNGQLVLAQSQALHQIDVSSLKPGLYFVQLRAGTEQQMRNIIVE